MQTSPMIFLRLLPVYLPHMRILLRMEGLATAVVLILTPVLAVVVVLHTKIE